MKRLLAPLLLVLALCGPASPQVTTTGAGLPPSGGGGSCTGTYDTDACNIFAAFTTPPDTSHKTVINTAVTCMKVGSPSPWSTLDVFYSLMGADTQAITINWKAPGSNTLTTPGTYGTDLIFSADHGVHNNASAANGYYSTNYTPPANYVHNNAAGGIYTSNTTSDVGSDMGDAGSQIQISARSGTAGTGKLDCSNANTRSTSTNTTGWHVVSDKPSTGVRALYGNGSAIGTANTCTDSVGYPLTVELIRSGGATLETRTLIAAHLGSSLGATNTAALYACVHAMAQTWAGIP